MNLSDEIMLAKLRKYTRLTSDQWLVLEAEVVKAGGILKATGTAHSELMFCAGMAREAVAKHPGHASQSSHGNGAPGSAGGSAAGGNTAAGQAKLAELEQTAAKSQKKALKAPDNRRAQFDSEFDAGNVEGGKKMLEVKSHREAKKLHADLDAESSRVQGRNAQNTNTNAGMRAMGNSAGAFEMMVTVWGYGDPKD